MTPYEQLQTDQEQLRTSLDRVGCLINEPTGDFIAIPDRGNSTIILWSPRYNKSPDVCPIQG